MGYNQNDVTTGRPNPLGAIYYAPVGTPLPTTTSTSVDAGFKLAGYVTDAGITSSFESSSEDLLVWGGIAVGSIKTEFSETFKLAFASTADKDVKEIVWGEENVTTNNNEITTYYNSGDRPMLSWVIERVLNDGRKEWKIYPKAKLTEIGDITYADADITAYELTFKAMIYEGNRSSYEITEMLITPVITNMDPLTGPVETVVTITGTNLTGATGVKLGTDGQAITPTEVTDTTVTFTIPESTDVGNYVVKLVIGENEYTCGNFAVTE